jgi:endonuclease YncB( thermonuclease family)
MEWHWPNSLATRIVDGDTFDALVRRDLGFGGSCQFPIRLRLNRINTQPAKTALGVAATQRAKELMIVGPVLAIDTYRTYKYGGGEVPEWMAEVTLPDARNVSDVLVAEGLALYWDGTGPRPGG